MNYVHFLSVTLSYFKAQYVTRARHGRYQFVCNTYLYFHQDSAILCSNTPIVQKVCVRSVDSLCHRS